MTVTVGLTKADLIAFEEEVKAAFLDRRIAAPIHLSSGNEDQLLSIFQSVDRNDWVFSTWRSHYHALLKGIPRQWLMDQILAGRSMYINNAAYNFLASSIVGGILPIAVGVAMGIKRKAQSESVWVFVGDMTAMTGIFQECVRYAEGHELPMRFVVEDNGLSTNTPTQEVWGHGTRGVEHRRYIYVRGVPHTGVGQWVNFG